MGRGRLEYDDVQGSDNVDVSALWGERRRNAAFGMDGAVLTISDAIVEFLSFL